MSLRVRERTLYEYIGRVFSKYGCKYVTQVGLKGKEPDLIIEFDGSKVVSEVKIDSEIKLEEAIFDAVKKAFILKTPCSMALMFTRDVREIPPTELERVYPNLKVSALIFTEWLTHKTDFTTLDNLANLIARNYQDWLRTKIPRVNYGLVVDVARGAIREIASYLRSHLAVKTILDSAMGVIGRFDIYKSLLEEVSGIPENEAKLYIADIASYVLANQLLFYQILSEKMEYEKFPDFNPIYPPNDLLDVIDKLFDNARSEYSKILGLDLFSLLRETKDLRILYSVARLVSTLKMLRPQHIKEDLFGRLYHETIPPETKKNLGAFYTKPEAAKLLATLAIDKWDCKILDPACGSGTLLVESYQRKAKLAPSINKDELHRKFAKEDIYGIDIMHFAAHMTATNLTSQNIRLKLEPNVFSRDGVEAMINPVNVDPDPPSIGQTLDKWIEKMSGTGIPSDFDTVIMNPPFTRRERIPDEISKLQKIVPRVKGKTGYWAYFVVPADNVLKPHGSLAVVMPEEFFVGRSAESVRSFLNEKGYHLSYVVRSAEEVAFSEAALYRDYLAVFKKCRTEKKLVVAILKRKLKDLQDDVENVALRLKEFSLSSKERISQEEFEAIKFPNGDELVTKHISNLKPLVGFTTVNAQLLALELLVKMREMPTLKELNNREKIRLRLYRPGQYRKKGVESYAQRLFTSRYGARSPNVVFLVDKVENESVKLRLKRKLKTLFDLPIEATIRSLRTYSSVRHLVITGEEEFGIVNPKAIPKHALKLSALIPFKKVLLASEDIKEAYKDFAGNILIARRIQLSSPNAYWLAFYSDNEVLGSQLPNIRVTSCAYGKILGLYLNSTLTLLQLLSFVAESRGAWVSLDHSRVWSNIHVPHIPDEKDEIIKKVKNLLSSVGKSDVKPLLQRYKEHDKTQRSIDELALEMVGLENWKNRLDELYDAVAIEIQAMHKILETSRRKR